MRLSQDDVDRVAATARDATLGRTFAERMTAIAAELSRLIPVLDFQIFPFDSSALRASSDGGLVMAPSGQGAVLAHVTRGEGVFGFMQDPSLTQQYFEHLARYDRFTWTLHARRYAPVRLSDCFTAAALRRRADPYLAAHVAPLGYRHGLAVHVPLTRGTTLAVGLARGPGDRDFRADESRLLGLIGPDLAVASLGAFLGDGLARAAGAPGAPAAVAAPGLGFLLFAPSGALSSAGGNALELVRRIDGRGRDPFSLVVAMAHAFARAGASPERRTFPLMQGGWLEARLGLVSRREREVLVVLEELRPGTGEHLEAACRAAGLTARERDVAAAGVRGLGVREIARELGVSLGTVKTHLRRVHEKAGTRSLVELARKLLAPHP